MYIKFNLDSKEVVEISSSPIAPEEGYGILYSDDSNLSEGDEFAYLITLDVTYLDDEYRLNGYNSSRYSPKAQEILEKINDANRTIEALRGENLVLQQAIIELTIVLGSMVGE